MARPRIELQNILEEILGSRNVYYSPPESIKIKYPCIIYERDNVSVDYADNSNYLKRNRYSIMLIDKSPTSDLPDRLLDLEYCSFDRHYVADNLDHNVFTLYF